MFAELWALFEAAASSGFAALFVVVIVAAYQTRELRRCRTREVSAEEQYRRVLVALARLYAVMRERSGIADELPPFHELLSDRRHEEVTI